jgi:hypothetical protein
MAEAAFESIAEALAKLKLMMVILIATQRAGVHRQRTLSPALGERRMIQQALLTEPAK